MGNLYEMMGKMKDGDVITSEFFSTDITRRSGAFYYSDGKKVLFGWGSDGFLTAYDHLEMHEWKLKDEYVEIDFNEVAERINACEDVFIDSAKRKIGRFTELSDTSIRDFDDIFRLTKFYKKA